MTIIRKASPVDIGMERQIITSMILNTDFLKQVQGFYSPECFDTNYTRMIADWCLNYFQNYEQAPKKDIQEIFRRQMKTNLQDDIKEQIKVFLSSISDEYESSNKIFNLEYALTNAEEHFRLVNIRNARDRLNMALTASDATEAENIIATFKRVARTKTKGISVFQDESIIHQAFDTEKNEMFGLPGQLGKMIGKFERGNLFSLVAGSGVGKSWWLMLIALRAVFAGLNVLFISYEMSEAQMMRRFSQWVTGRPTKAYPEGILLPIFDCKKNQMGVCRDGCRKSIFKSIKKDKDGNIDAKESLAMTPAEAEKIGYEVCTKCRGKREYEIAVWHKVIQRDLINPEIAIKKFNRARTLGRVGQIRMVQFPSQTQSISDLKAFRENLKYFEGFQEDVLITDYADKMLFNSENYRLGLNEIWEGHKSIAQQDNILVVTASQTNADRGGKDIKDGDYAESIHKKNVLDGAMSINQTKEERVKGIFRMEPMKKRHDGFDALGQVWVLGQYKIGRPYLDSEIKGGLFHG